MLNPAPYLQKTLHLAASCRLRAALLLLTLPAAAQAADSPWENAVDVIMRAFTGPIAKGLALVSIVIGGLTFAFGEAGSKRMFAGILFGCGMAVSALNFFNWLFQ